MNKHRYLSKPHEKQELEITYRPFEKHVQDICLSDATTMYLKDIRSFDLLNQEEEICLAKIVQNEELPEAERDAAKKKLAEANLRLVVSVAKKYTAKTLDLIDLIGAGNEGLLVAIDKFNPDLGNKLSTYASFWIKNAILRAIYDSDSTVRLPVYLYEQKAAITKAAKALEVELGRFPTMREIAKAVGKDEQDIIDLFEAFNNINVVPFETPIGGDDKSNDTTLGDLIADKYAVDPEYAATQMDMQSEVRDVMKKVLNDKEYDVLSRRYGIFSTPQTLQEIASDYHITRERVRQIQMAAQKKLSNSVDAKTLRTLL